MAYCPTLKTCGRRESLLVFHWIHCASKLQFPVWVLSGATWKCTPVKPHTAPCAHLLLFHLCFYFAPSLFSLLHFSILPFTLLLCLCNVMISMLRTSIALPGLQSLRQSVSCLTVSHTADQSPASHMLNYSCNCTIDRSATYSISHLFIKLIIYFYSRPVVHPWKYTCRRYTEIEKQRNRA